MDKQIAAVVPGVGSVGSMQNSNITILGRHFLPFTQQSCAIEDRFRKAKELAMADIQLSLTYNAEKVVVGDAQEIAKVQVGMSVSHPLVVAFHHSWRFMGLLDGSKETKFIAYLERMEGEITFEESLQPLFDCLDYETN